MVARPRADGGAVHLRLGLRPGLLRRGGVVTACPAPGLLLGREVRYTNFCVEELFTYSTLTTLVQHAKFGTSTSRLGLRLGLLRRGGVVTACLAPGLLLGREVRYTNFCVEELFTYSTLTTLVQHAKFGTSTSRLGLLRHGGVFTTCLAPGLLLGRNIAGPSGSWSWRWSWSWSWSWSRSWSWSWSWSWS